jgi:hypothetical protein
MEAMANESVLWPKYSNMPPLIFFTPRMPMAPAELLCLTLGWPETLLEEIKGFSDFTCP